MTAITTIFAAVLVVAGSTAGSGGHTCLPACRCWATSWWPPAWGTTMLVIFQNRYAAATITVEKNQPLTDTGLYRIVRHPGCTRPAW